LRLFAKVVNFCYPVVLWPAVAVNRLIDANRLPHLLFYGPPGTGKTSTILACAKRMYGADMSRMVLEVRSV
jgi:replication-associated recombination protein RarA